MAIVDRKILTSSYVSGQHAAHAMHFDVLYWGLQNEVKAGNVRKIVNDTGGLEIYSYTTECQFDNQWNVFSLIARGLVIAPKEKRIVATTFPKFFNFGETDNFIPNLSFTATEKFDGSLGIIYWWDGDWRVNTGRSFKSEQARWAKKFLDKNINKDKMVQGWTYLAEIIYPENRIVIPYDYEALVLLSIYGQTGFEFLFKDIRTEAVKTGFAVPKWYEYDSVTELLALTEHIPYDEEGFVVRFANGYRLKIKGDEYCRVHKLISNVKPIYIWECMINGDNLTAIEKDLPEEMRKDFNAIADILQEKFEDIVYKLTKAHDETKHLSDKELGLMLKHEPIGEDRVIRTMLFLVRKKNLLNDVMRPKSKGRKQIFKLFKPKGNHLKGYVPTNAMNRFDENERNN